MKESLLRIVCAASFASAFLALGILIGGVVSKPQHISKVCNVTNEQPTMIAAVDPKTGELFAVPTLQTVCIDAGK